jgi:UDP-N-acetylmuramate dehydrogenase
VSFADLLPALKAAAPETRGRLLANQSLAEFTWFRVGGPAQVLFTPADEDDLAYFLAHLDAAIPVTVIGVGSNLIVRDGGIAGVVIRLAPKGFGAVIVNGDMIEAGAAALDKRVATFAGEAGLAGLEFMVGIPGSVGGALRMNAGAHGRETKDALISARAVTRRGEKITIDNAGMGFSYRKSKVPADHIFTAGLYRGTPEAKGAIAARMAEVTAHREAAQPIREKTGGSTFKNPPGNSAWKVVDAAGCRGLIVGGAQVSEMHCNFLINRGDATAADIENLGEEVRRRVREHSGVALEWEIKRIGEAR